jgi:hypothetical protein
VVWAQKRIYSVGETPASAELKAFIRTLTERAEKLKKERVDRSAGQHAEDHRRGQESGVGQGPLLNGRLPRMIPMSRLPRRPHRFIVLDAQALDRQVQIGDRLSFQFIKGRPSINREDGRAR